MKFIDRMPQSEEQRSKKKKSLTLRRKALSGLCFACAIAAILLVIGMLVALLMAELGNFAAETQTLLYILAGSFGGGAVAFALLAVLFARLSQKALAIEADFIERCDGERSFFVGEGTLATFGDGGVRLHSEESGKVVFVPYDQMRFFSVCSRTRPKEKGTWSVLMEIPAKFLTQNAEREGEKALVQMDAKQRLYDCLKEEGLCLLGEPHAARPSEKKFTPVRKYVRPDRQKRMRALILMGASIAAVVAGIVVAFLAEVTLGSVLCVLGAFVCGRAIYAFLAAKGLMVLYREGLWWSEQKNPSASVFLKWEEIERVYAEHAGEVDILTVHCAYGDYHFPVFDGIEREIDALMQAQKQE